MNKHPECEANPEGCRLKEAKGYTTCQRQGVCNEMALRDFHEKILIKATLDLFESTASAAFKIPIPNTTPPLFIMAGEENALASSETEKPDLSVGELTALIDYHDVNDAEADAMGVHESADYHQARSKMYAGMRARLERPK